MGFIRMWLTGISMIVSLSCASSPAVPSHRYHRFEFSHRQMGTLFTIIAYARDSMQAVRAAKDAFNRVDALNHILSDYQEDSELSQLSATAGTGKKVPVSDDLWKVLLLSVDMSRQSHGAFDITVGPYVQLWRRARRQQVLPTEETLAKARERVGYTYIQLYPTQQAVELTRPGMKLDAGGVGKGYAVDEAMKTLKKHGIRHALIDGGGNILVSKAPPGKKGWQVGISFPEAENPSALQNIEISHMAVATSGDVYQYMELDGKRYSHIVDPRTGIGLTSQINVTILAKNGSMADLLSTAVSVMGKEEGLALIEKTKYTAAVIFAKSGNEIRIFTSEWMNKIIRKNKTKE